MIDQLPAIKQLLSQLQQVPYMASKNLYRVAAHFLHMDETRTQQFCMALLELKRSLAQCGTCFVWQEKGGSCLFCSSTKRNQATVCVVEGWQELLAMERTGGYQGVYHLLGGVICPLEGVGPDDLTIDALVERVAKGEVQEIILAMNQTPEGETTSTFIAQQLKHSSVTVTCLARGVPIGSSLEFTDRLTLYKALADRRPF